MASSGQDSVSRACLQAGSKNMHCKSTLQHELQLLDKEKEYLLNNLRHEARQFQQHFPNHLSSADRRTTTSTRYRDTEDSGRPKSPRAITSPSRNHSSAVGDKSPRPHHNSGSVHNERSAVVMEMASKHTDDVPQIVVSDATEQKGATSPSLKGRGRKVRDYSPSTARSMSGSDSERGSPLSQSLNLRSFRERSDSMPGLSQAHCLSHIPVSSASDLKVPEIQRGRSNSFSSIQPARRRGSIMEQWGSISERNRPVMGSFKGRRRSVDMENLLRDLSFGVQHSELMALNSKRPSVSDKQWQELKQCRYLRIPSKGNSQEDVSQD